MIRHRKNVLGLALLAVAVAACPARAAEAPNLVDLQEKAIKDAVAKVAPSIVQVQTIGGLDVISSGRTGVVRKGIGPTTGVIVGADGWIISSAFNFVNKPSRVIVVIPGKGEFPATIKSNDTSRMLTLLKIDAKDLPVPTATPKKEMQVGQWAIALGRTWSNVDQPPSISIGIISALDRIWGKAIQTDAKISPVNYGGALIDIKGRVQGVIVPASPRGQDEISGLEWYDGGIGFAIPLEDIFAVLEKLKKGDLKRGLLGVTPQGGDIYSVAAVVGQVQPNSAADRAGIKPGDRIVEIDGKPIERQAQVMHALGPKYEGDKVTVKVKRGNQDITLEVVLSSSVPSSEHAFLGILPMRDDPETGVEVRHVYAKSPAEAAGLKVGDRILKIARGKENAQNVANTEALTTFLNGCTPGTEVKLEVKRKADGKTESLSATLGKLAEVPIPDQLPKEASKGRSPAGDKKDPNKKPETGMLKRSNAAKDHEYWVYVPDDYDPSYSYALVCWLHPVGQGKERDAEKFVRIWEDVCSEHRIILVGPKASTETGWLVEEAGFVVECVRDVMNQYNIDKSRVVAHGMDLGGQLAYVLAFNNRDLIRGVANTGALLKNQIRENVANQRLSFFIVCGDKDPILPAVEENAQKLTEAKFPVVFRKVADMGHIYLSSHKETFAELIRWIDSLDRQ